MTHKKRKYRLNWKHVIPTFLVLAAILTAVVFLSVKLTHKKNGGNKNEAPTETVNVNDYVSKDEYISINMSNCTMYVGTVARLTCSSEPDQYADKVIWSSSNPDSVLIDPDGTITVIAPGSAAITATYGNLTDSTVVVALSPDSEDETEYPTASVVNGEIVIPGLNNNGNGNNIGIGSNSNNNDESSAGITETTTGNSNSEKPSENNGNTPANETPTSHGNSSGDKDEQSVKSKLTEKITSLGFTEYYKTDDVDIYTYYEDGNYLGEVIIQNNQMQIYVKTRTSGFDSAAKALLKIILPSSYDNVYSIFITTGKNQTQTLNADGHMVRIIAPVKDSHSQLIVSY